MSLGPQTLKCVLPMKRDVLFLNLSTITSFTHDAGRTPLSDLLSIFQSCQLTSQTLQSLSSLKQSSTPLSQAARGLVTSLPLVTQTFLEHTVPFLPFFVNRNCVWGILFTVEAVHACGSPEHHDCGSIASSGLSPALPGEVQWDPL